MGIAPAERLDPTLQRHALSRFIFRPATMDDAVAQLRRLTEEVVPLVAGKA